MMNLLLLLLLLITPVMLFGQKQKTTVINSQAELQEYITQDLDQRIQEGELYQWASSNGIKGEYSFDITLHKKCKILTVYMASSNADDLSIQNQVKDRIRALNFSCRIPKKQRYKVNYTFIF